MSGNGRPFAAEIAPPLPIIARRSWPGWQCSNPRRSARLASAAHLPWVMRGQPRAARVAGSAAVRMNCTVNTASRSDARGAEAVAVGGTSRPVGTVSCDD